MKMYEQIYKIDPEGKYIIILENASEYQAEEFFQKLQEWWDSDKVIFGVAFQGITKIRLERLNEKGDENATA